MLGAGALAPFPSISVQIKTRNYDHLFLQENCSPIFAGSRC